MKKLTAGFDKLPNLLGFGSFGQFRFQDLLVSYHLRYPAGGQEQVFCLVFVPVLPVGILQPPDNIVELPLFDVAPLVNHLRQTIVGQFVPPFVLPQNTQRVKLRQQGAKHLLVPTKFRS